jgi:signal transduction histidine kinase
MFGRLEESKAALKANIVSLERANREIRKAQDDLIKSEKLASVGRLATGVAHEVGNPLGIVTGYLELLKSGHPDREERMDYLDRIEYEIGRISQTIRQLLAFSESGGVRELTRVHAVIRETIAGLDPYFTKARIEVKPSFEAGDDAVWAHPLELKQVISNVLLNAVEAMWPSEEDGEGATAGRITVATLNEGGLLRIRFTDTGPGIPAEVLSRVFEPFFTTKETGRGRGLGLSVCHRVVNELGGRISVESGFGTGTSVFIDIPLHGLDNEVHGKKDGSNGTGTRSHH